MVVMCVVADNVLCIPVTNNFLSLSVCVCKCVCGCVGGRVELMPIFQCGIWRDNYLVCFHGLGS